MTPAESRIDAMNRHLPADGNDYVDLTLRIPVEVEATVGVVVARQHSDRCRPAREVVRQPAAERLRLPRLRAASGCGGDGHEHRRAVREDRGMWEVVTGARVIYHGSSAFS